MEEHGITVKTVTIPSLINIAIKHGVSAEELLYQVGINAEMVSDPDSVISLDQLDALYEATARVTRNDAFGLYIGALARFDSLNLIGSLIATAPSIRVALDQYHRFRELQHPFMDFRLEESSIETAIIYAPVNPTPVMMKPIYSEMFLSAILKIATSLTEKGIALRRVQVLHSEPSYSSIYRKLFGENIEYNQKCSALIVNSDLLDKPLLGSFPPLFDSLQKQAEKLLNQLQSHRSIEKQVTSYLYQNMGRKVVSMQDVAGKLEVTSRTLQRRLKKEDTSYVALREQVRFELAQRYLEDSHLTMDKIANRLGFSEPTNFYHAFKRWTNISPGEYRKRYNQQSAKA